MSASKKILLLTDFPETVEHGHDFKQYIGSAEWETETDVYRALEKLGHDVHVYAAHDDIRPLVSMLQKTQPDLVFNLCESFRGDRDHEPNIAALFELMGVRHTGASSSALRLCKDKGMTKVILSYHGITVPAFEVSRRAKPLRSLPKDFKYPAIIKPLNLEASEGISQTSIVQKEEDAMERIRYLHEKFSVDVIVEQYIDGRELYVGVLGREQLTTFGVRELFFKEVPDGEPKIATYKAKWDDRYRKRWGIDSGTAQGLSEELGRSITETCKKIYRLLKITGYGRIDLRLAPNGEIYFLEANPNPSLAKDEEFAQGALQSGVEYEDLIARIVRVSLLEG